MDSGRNINENANMKRKDDSKSKMKEKSKRKSKRTVTGVANVKVSLGTHSYDVKIGGGIVDNLGAYLKSFPEKKAFLVSDEQLTDHRARVLGILKNAGWQVHELAVKAGEPLKDIESVFSIYGSMLRARIDRHSTLIALGGGSVGDAAGFVASTYMRGLRWIGLPTTLLGQVDSAIGGKTAINHPEGKNLIGTFHQPQLVVCETHFLKTLSQREIISGMGEVIKYGLTFDRKLWSELPGSWAKILDLDDATLTKLIKSSVKWKARSVAKDEFDLRGVREVLNFGHTFGHALEKVTNYQRFQHGEAVIWGQRFAAALSLRKKKITLSTWKEIDSFLQFVPVPALPADIAFEAYASAMLKDKKMARGKIRFVLLSKIGASVLENDISEKDLKAAFKMIGGLGAK